MTSTRRTRTGLLSAFALGATMLAAVPATFGGTVSAATDDLFISEYVEGSSFNKAIEIYNGTGAPVDLAAGGYALELYSNGASDPNNTNELTGTIADGDVYVIANSSASFVADADATGSAVNFNGDDAVVLTKNGAVLDAFGQVGTDPGSEWPGGGQNDTLRRLPSICAGDTNADDAFVASVEWDVLAQDTFDGLGSHTADCGDGGGGGGGDDPEILINEFDADQSGTDAAEFVELTDGGVGGTDLSGLTLVFYNGSNDESYAAIDLSGVSTNADGYAVVCGNTDAVANCDLDGGADTNFIQNGADAIALYEGSAADFPNGTAITTDGLVEAVVYGTSDGDDAELLALLDAGQAQVDEDANGTKDTDSNQRCPDSSGAARQTDRYALFAPTPGAANVCEIVVPPLDCDTDVELTSISTIQGSGFASPIVDQDVTVEAAVTGVFADLGGIYLQEEPGDSDGDSATSEGIFVFFGSAGVPDVAVGDIVRVQGPVAEFETSNGASSLTQIRASAIAGCDAAPVTIEPVEITLPLGTADQLEAVEGMLVTLPQDLVIAEYFNYDRFGEVVVSSERRFTPTAIVEPGPEAIALAAENELDRLTIDDGRSNQNPDPAIHPGNGDEFTLDNRFRGGDTITGTVGVIDDTFGIYRLQPTTYGTYTVQNPRPAAPADVGGDITVSSFNVLNYFTTLDDSGSICGPTGGLDCRGADDAEELDRQRDKIVAALAAIDADVVGLIEIENNANDDAVIDLVASLNAVVGTDTYSAIETGAIGTDAIKVAIIYKSAVVAAAGDFAVLDSSVDARFIDTKNRPVLAQSFTEIASGETFTVAVNHLKSKGSPCDDVGDPGTGDGSANCNGVRTDAAEAMVDWLATDPTDSSDPDVLIIGDLNAYDKETPIDAIIEGADDTVGTDDDYTDLIFRFEGEEAYSFTFDGQIGYLDHALANTSLNAQVTGATEWHINADEPDILNYDTSFKRDAQDALYAPDPYRSSDHDPVIVGLDLASEPVVEPLRIDAAVLARFRNGAQRAVVSGGVDAVYEACPTFALSIDGTPIFDGALNRFGTLCFAFGSGGIVTFDLATSDFTANVSVPRSFRPEDLTITFGLMLDDSAFEADVEGRRIGRRWVAF